MAEINDSTDTSELAKQQLAKIAYKVTDSEFRLACSDIAESLTKLWKFKFTIFGMIFLSLLVLAGVYFTFFGVSVRDLTHDEIEKAKIVIDKSIKKEFQETNIRKTVEQVAASKSTELLQKTIQPSIDSSKKELVSFNQYLKKQEQTINKAVLTMQEEVVNLQKRNEITALADKAIGGGSVLSYRQLNKLVQDDNEAAISEMIRVMSTYGPSSTIMRWDGTKLNASAINPSKTKEEELDIKDLSTVLSGLGNAPGRARAAELLAQVGKSDPYKAGKIIVENITNEDNLWVIKQLIQAFQNIINYAPADGTIDGSDILEWWGKHAAEVAKKDTNKK